MKKLTRPSELFSWLATAGVLQLLIVPAWPWPRLILYLFTCAVVAITTLVLQHFERPSRG